MGRPEPPKPALNDKVTVGARVVLAIKVLLDQVKRRGLSYWVRVVFLAGVGLWLGSWMGSQQVWIELRYKIYQAQLQLAPRKPLAERTVLVLIGDDDYWKGDLGRRVPIKRSYLAKLVEAIDAGDPVLIALDFDFSSPVPDGSLVEHPDYWGEREAFLKAVKDASQHRKIVLPRTIDFDEQGRYVLRSDIYDGFDFGPTKDNIRTGYIALPYDFRQVPMGLRLHGGNFVDSFATAIVRASFPNAFRRIPQGSSMPFGSYLRVEEFRQVSASDVLKGSKEALEQLAYKIVIVGAAWRKQGYGRGDQIDTYLTPVGWIGGAFIHANYAEALLDGRIYEPLGWKFVLGAEIVLVLVIAIIFALDFRPRNKWSLAGALSLILLMVNYFFIQNLGAFFDFFVPLFLVAGHSVVDQVLEWRRLARSKDLEEVTS